MKLISLTQDDLNTIEKELNNVDYTKAIQDIKQSFFKYSSLTPKQIKFAGSVLNQAFKDDFNINGNKNQTDNNQLDGSKTRKLM